MHFLRSGKPFFPVGGQAHNSSADSAEGLDTALRALRIMGGNTITIPVCWEQIEPVEGCFDWALVDALVHRVAQEGVALIIDWFGTWKNGSAKYVPQWVKTQPERFRRVEDAGGGKLCVLSSLCEANLQADKRAFVALMGELKRLDPRGDTLIAVQVENEPGIYPGANREYSAQANQLFFAPLPEALVTFLQTNPHTALTQQWRVGHTQSWPDAFGTAAEELFTAWSISGYIDEIAQAGSAVYPTTYLVNAWVEQKGWHIAGMDYPAGGPVQRTLDVWKLRTPHISVIAPDAYLQTSAEYHACMEAYSREDNPLFIPEAGKEEWHSRFMAEAVGTHHAIGYMCFGLEGVLDSQGQLCDDCAAAAGTMQAMEAMAGAFLHYAHCPLVTIQQAEYATMQYMEWENYLAVAYFIQCKGGSNDGDWNWHDFRHGNHRERLVRTGARGRGWVMQTGAHEFVIAGDGFRMQFFPRRMLTSSLSPLWGREGLIGRAAPYLTVEEGRFTIEGAYQPCRTRNGDESDFGIWTEPDCGAIRVRMIP